MGVSPSVLRRTIGGGPGLTKRLFHAGADKARGSRSRTRFCRKRFASTKPLSYRRSTRWKMLSPISTFGRKRTPVSRFRHAFQHKRASGRVRDAYTSGLVEVGDLLRVVEEDLEIRTEHLFARNLLSKGQRVRLYKAAGGGTVAAASRRNPGESGGDPESVGLSDRCLFSFRSVPITSSRFIRESYSLRNAKRFCL